jgi:hypothetical protein
MKFSKKKHTHTLGGRGDMVEHEKIAHMSQIKTQKCVFNILT